MQQILGEKIRFLRVRRSEKHGSFVVSGIGWLWSKACVNIKIPPLETNSADKVQMDIRPLVRFRRSHEPYQTKKLDNQSRKKTT